MRNPCQIAVKIFSAESKIKGIKSRIEDKFKAKTKVSKNDDPTSLENLQTELTQAEQVLRTEKHFWTRRLKRSSI